MADLVAESLLESDALLRAQIVVGGDVAFHRIHTLTSDIGIVLVILRDVSILLVGLEIDGGIVMEVPRVSDDVLYDVEIVPVAHGDTLCVLQATPQHMYRVGTGRNWIELSVSRRLAPIPKYRGLDFRSVSG